MRVGYLAILPSTIRHDKDLTPNSKLIYAEISAMVDTTGTIEANTEFICFLCDLFALTEVTVRSSINELIRRGALEARDGIISLSKGKYTQIERKSPEGAKNTVKQDLIPACEKFIEKWNELFGTRMKVISLLMNKLKQRLNSYELDDILKAVENRSSVLSQSEWHNKPENIHHLRSYDKFLRTDAEIQKYLLIDTKSEKKPSELNFF